MKPQTAIKLRKAKKIYKATKLSITEDHLIPSIGYNRIINILSQIEDNCPLATYRINQLINKINN